MTPDDDHDGLAAEYVLGTLDAFEREQVEALMATDPAFSALVRGWERRLGELHALVPSVEPPPETWEKIKAQIARPAAGADQRSSPDLPAASATPAAAKPAGAEVIMLSRRVRRWRGLAAATSALAACLVMLVAAREISPGLLPEALRPTSVAQAPGRFVAVLQRDADSPAFLLTVDVASRSLTVRRVAAVEAGKSQELWLISDRFPAPRSLGVIAADTFTVRPLQASYDPATLEGATYAVSLEPEGGSPTGQPTGPVLFLGKLVEATPPRT